MNRQTVRPSGGLRAVKVVAGIGLIVLVVFTVLEMGLRIFSPQDVTASFAVGEALIVEDETLGHRLAPQAAVTVRGPEFSALYRINPQGFRDRVEHDFTKPQGTMRILILGDGFAFGAGSRYEATWPVLFEQKLKGTGYDVEVINAGTLGYDTRSEVLYLKELLPRYEPDFVILALAPDDLITNTSADAALPPVPDVSEKNASVHLARFVTRTLMSADGLYCRFFGPSDLKAFFQEGEGGPLRKRAETTRDHLLRANALCDAAGATFSVLSIPHQFQVVAGARNESGVEVNRLDEVLGEYAEEAGFRWVRCLPELVREYRAFGRDLYHRYAGHLTAEGNRVVAEYLYVLSTEHYKGY